MIEAVAGIQKTKRCGLEVDGRGDRDGCPESRVFRGVFENHVAAERVADDDNAVFHDRRWQAAEGLMQVTASTRVILRPTKRAALSGAAEVELKDRVAKIEEVGRGGLDVGAVGGSSQTMDEDDKRSVLSMRGLGAANKISADELIPAPIPHREHQSLRGLLRVRRSHSPTDDIA